MSLLNTRGRVRPTRILAALATTLVTALVASGCASGDADPAAPTPQQSQSDAPRASSGGVALPAGEGTTSYPLTLASPFGETAVAQRPERVAVISAATVDTDALLALGVVPVLAPSTIERNPWLDETLTAGIEERWSSSAADEVSAEQVAAVDPDLIVAMDAYDMTPQRFEQLSAIAPVLYAESEALTWQEMTREVGEVLDLSEAADGVVDDAEQRISAAAAAHPEFAGHSAAHVVVYEEQYGAAYDSTPGSDSAALLEALGFTLPAAAEQFGDDDVVSQELIGSVDADFLLVSLVGTDDHAYFLDSPLLQSVPAVAEGRVVINEAGEDGTNSFAWGLRQQSALSAPWLVETLADFGSEAVDQ